MMTPEFFDLVSHIYTFSILHSFIYITFFFLLLLVLPQTVMTLRRKPAKFVLVALLLLVSFLLDIPPPVHFPYNRNTSNKLQKDDGC